MTAKGSYSIDGWCGHHDISRRTFYDLEKIGKAPRTFYVGTRRRISAEADLEWQHEREVEAETPEAKSRREARSESARAARAARTVAA